MMIGRLRDAWRGYWFSPAPLLDLAVCRIVIVGYQLQVLVTMDHVEAFGTQADLPSTLYDPLPVLHALIWPFGWTYRPSFEVLEAIYVLGVAVGGLALIGLWSRLSLVLFAVASVFLQAHAYSFGDFHHSQGPVIIALAVLALSPAGKVLSVDGLRRGRGSGSGGAEDGPRSPRGGESPHARWPRLVIAWVLGLAYLSAAVTKLQHAGLEWMNGHTLRYYLFQDGLRWDADLGVWLGTKQHLAVALSWATFLFEALFITTVVVPGLALLFVPLGIAMHVGIYITMKATFLGWIALYAVFVPWTRVRGWLKAARAHARRGELLPHLRATVARGGGYSSGRSSGGPGRPR